MTHRTKNNITFENVTIKNKLLADAFLIQLKIPDVNIE